MNIKRPENMVPSAFETLLKRYEAAGDDFQITTKPYYSTGGILFERDSTFGTLASADRVAMRARAGQKIHFFSYQIGQDVTGVQLGARAATEADTNLAEAQETNDEDFAIEGLSATAVAVRLNYALGAGFAAGFPGVSADMTAALDAATSPIVDPASIVVPAEVGSPLVLEDVLFEALKPHITLQEQWNRKGGDNYGTLDQIPEGGAKSYLKSSGEPTHHNFFRLPEGKIWAREGSPQDTKFVLQAVLQRDVFVIVSEPDLVVTETPTQEIGDLTELWLDWKLRLHGHAFYYPSRNA